MQTPDREALTAIRDETTSTWREVFGDLPRGTRVALVDFPNHQNVGDSLIWAGEEAHLRRMGIKVGYRSDARRFDEERLRSRTDGPILLHGGGNFGDVWPEYQEFREHLVERFHDRKVVVLPQSLFFASPVAAARANSVFSAHPDVTVLLREESSLERAQRDLPDVRVCFCPDAALGADLERKGSPDVDVVLLLRQDHEAKQGVSAGFADEAWSSLTVDWGLSSWRRAVFKALRVPGRLHSRGPARVRGLLYPAVEASLLGMVAINLDAGVRILSRGRVVVTDRLHAHVMCCLMGIPHVVMDNNYGKVSSVRRATTHVFSVSHWADDTDAARRLVRSLLTASGAAASDRP